MQRLLICACKVASSDHVGLSSTLWNLQIVRWRKRPMRKPFWLGRAKSKLAVFEMWPKFRPGEGEEIQRLMNNYRTAMKSLYQYFKVEFDMKSDTSELGKQRAEADKREHEHLMEENRLENERLAKLRDVRVANELKATRDDLKARYDAFEEQERKRIEEADKLIQFYKAMPVISAETLDEAIDKALEVEEDYNYAIDLQGNIFKGKRTRPDAKQGKDSSAEDTNTSELRSEAH